MDEIKQNEEGMTPQESLKIISKVLNKVQDDNLWKIAKKRSAFKVSLAVYLVVNAFLIALWYITTGLHSYFWPMWPMAGWGLAMAMQFVDAYFGNGVFSEEKEFEKLKKKTNNE